MSYKNLNDNQVTIQCNLSNGLIGAAKKGRSDLGRKAISKILATYPDINKVWLLTGEGNMILEKPAVDETANESVKQLSNLELENRMIKAQIKKAEDMNERLLRIVERMGIF
ncbi:MAG: hypothetical protein J5676_01520 [Bacteroidaceae bacterium]|nr:hypothetical protein [Bacteroidaceae bacterium]